LTFRIDLSVSGTRKAQNPGKSIKKGAMADLFNLVMLICACVGSMAFGILAAYGILRAGFALMRPQPRPVVAKTRPQVAPGL
jgi:hypothetical protein